MACRGCARRRQKLVNTFGKLKGKSKQQRLQAFIKAFAKLKNKGVQPRARGNPGDRY